MKKTLSILTAILFSATLYAAPTNVVKAKKKESTTIPTAKNTIHQPTNNFKKELKETFTDDCGVEWTVIASCGSCSAQSLENGINDWKNEHYNPATGCYDGPIIH